MSESIESLPLMLNAEALRFEAVGVETRGGTLWDGEKRVPQVDLTVRLDGDGYGEFVVVMDSAEARGLAEQLVSSAERAEAEAENDADREG